MKNERIEYSGSHGRRIVEIGGNMNETGFYAFITSIRHS